MFSTVFLLLMSLLAGVLTGIVGMASLTIYPVLLSLGIPPVSANATATVATVGAGVSTVLSSLKELKGHWRLALTVGALSTAGSITGALILAHSSNAGFAKVAPIFILMAGVLLLAPAPATPTKWPARWQRVLQWLAVSLIGCYNGYFGAASGLLMIAVLSRVIGGPYPTYNAIRNFAALLDNVFSTLIFIFMVPIQWSVMIPLLVGLVLGGYVGPIIVRYIPSAVIKKLVGVVALILAAYLGWQAYM